MQSASQNGTLLAYLQTHHSHQEWWNDSTVIALALWEHEKIDTFIAIAKKKIPFNLLEVCLRHANPVHLEICIALQYKLHDNEHRLKIYNTSTDPEKNAQCSRLMIINKMYTKRDMEYLPHGQYDSLIDSMKELSINIITLSALKLRRITGMKNLDRFLMHELALEMWRSRKDYL